jgi:hypothetical protein
MPPVNLSRTERASLQRLAERPCQPGDIPADHEEKFLNYGLARRHAILLSVTPLGQCELLRQRFRDIPFPQMPVTLDMIEEGALLLKPVREG